MTRIFIAIDLPEGATVSVRQEGDTAAAGQEVFADLEDLGPIPTPDQYAPAFHGAANAPAGQFPPFGSNPAVQNPWAEGMVHAAGHKPLKRNTRGLFCPTVTGTAPDGKKSYCEFRA